MVDAPDKAPDDKPDVGIPSRGGESRSSESFAEPPRRGLCFAPARQREYTQHTVT